MAVYVCVFYLYIVAPGNKMSKILAVLGTRMVQKWAI